MPTTYEQAKPEVFDMARDIMERHHSADLRMSDGTFPRLCILMATSGDDEPAIKLHGYACAAVISVIPYKQRVDKRADAEIIIDAWRWESLSGRQKEALLDHEITHLEFHIDDGGFVKTDDEGRPKLRLKLHDWNLGGFRSIAKRYGDDALEVLEARKFEEDYGADMMTAKVSGLGV